MNAKEIRIDNLVNRNGLIVSADAKTIYDILYYPEIAKQYQFVELNKEILLKYKFELKSCFRKTVNNIEFILLVDIVLPYPRGYSMRLFVNGNYICNVEHFHHLQNIIFDLTGKELTL